MRDNRTEALANHDDEKAWLLRGPNGMLDLRTGDFHTQPEATTSAGSPGSPGVPPPSPVLPHVRTATPLNLASREKNGEYPGDLGGPGDPPAVVGSDDPETAKRVAFLEALSGCGSVAEAARAVGLASRTPRRWARDDEAFAAVLDKAKEVGLLVRLDSLEQEVDRRARDGVDVPVYQGGRLVGHRREFSDLLLMFRMKRLDPAYRDQQPRTGDVANIQIAITGPGGVVVTLEDGRQVLAASDGSPFRKPDGSVVEMPPAPRALPEGPDA